jgi:glycosyltransferase involved in cell wall biosynthesis
MEPPQRILIFSAFFPPEKGAASNRIFNMAVGLKERGFDVGVVTALPNYPKGRIFPEYAGRFQVEEEQAGIQVRRYWIFATISKNAVLRLFSMISFCLSLLVAARALRKMSPQICIVQGHPLFITWTAVLLSKFWFRAKTILNVSDIWPLSALELGAIKPGRMYRLLERLEAFNYRHSDAIIGQSQEILDHVAERQANVALTLYRNLPRRGREIPMDSKRDRHRTRVIYAGLLGYAQNIAGIVEDIDWEELGVELTIYGEGGDRERIAAYLKENPTPFVRLMNMVAPAELDEIITGYHAALVPLATRIQGAVPSKLFELAHQRVPVLFSGGGEGAQIVSKFNLGWISEPGNMQELRHNLQRLKDMDEEEYEQVVWACDRAAREEFDFDRQMDGLAEELRGDVVEGIPFLRTQIER